MFNIKKTLIISLLTSLPFQLLAGSSKPAMVPIISYLLSDTKTIINDDDSYLDEALFSYKEIDIRADKLQTRQATITKAGTITHNLDENFKGSNTYILKDTSSYKLINHSFNKYKSLLAKYTINNNEYLLKLEFSQDIEPFTKYNIDILEDVQKLEIVQSASMFNSDFRFHTRNGNCERIPDRRDKLCMSTPEEQEKYLTALSNIHYFYNSIDLMNVYDAWTHEGSYTRNNYNGISVTLDYKDFKQTPSKYYEVNQSIEHGSTLEDYLHEKLFSLSIPNHITSIRTIHNPSARGWGNGAETAVFGEYSSLGYAAVRESTIKYIEDFYNVFHHESVHGFGYSHKSALTYGFSDALGQAILKFYNLSEKPVHEVPKYVFKTKILADKKLLVSVFSATQLDKKSLKVEFLSVQNNKIKVIPQGNNSFIIEMKDRLATRMFMRVLGDDSQEVMSRLLYPVDFRLKQELITHNNQNYYMISNEEWIYIRSHSVFKDRYKIMSKRSVIEMCRGWLDLNAIATGAEVELLHTTYADDVADITSPIFVARELEEDDEHDFKLFHNLDAVWKEKVPKTLLLDSGGNILCKP